MNNPWFHLARKASTTSGVHLFCFPYAGGSINSLRPLVSHIDAHVSCHIASLPGRGARFAEAPVASIGRLGSFLCDAIEQIQPRHFVLYGHSMGGILGFEVARELRRRGFTAPAGLVVSAVSAPHRFGRPEAEYRHDLPRAEFIAYLRTLEGTPPAFFEHPELMEMMLPMLRADFQACDTYAFRPETPLDIPIRALSGKDDRDVREACMQAWSVHTRSSFRLSVHQGGHFFIEEAWAEVAEVLNATLAGERIACPNARHQRAGIFPLSDKFSHSPTDQHH